MHVLMDLQVNASQSEVIILVIPFHFVRSDSEGEK
jgi:hypothetical protein